MQEILFLAHRVPWPADRGDKIRSNNILKRLTELGRVHLGAFADDARDMNYSGEMRKFLASQHVELRTKPQWRAGIEALRTGQPVSLTSFHSEHMQDWINELLSRGKVSHIFVFSGQMAQYVPANFNGKLIMDFVDVDSAKFESYAGDGNPAMRWINAREGRLLSDFEHDVARRADASLFVSDAEAALFRERSGLRVDKVMPLSNGIDTLFYDPKADFELPTKKLSGPIIAFTGQMDYRPNVEAVSDFAANAMPAILEEFPRAKFVIVGRNPAPAVRALATLEGVEVTGAVDDVRSWLSIADVVVAPLRIARGIQNKVLEAMAMAKPVVASTAAAEGIAAADGKHFIIAPSVAKEARAVIELLQDKKRCQKIGLAARGHVIDHYGWAHQLQPLDDLLGIQNYTAQAAE